MKDKKIVVALKYFKGELNPFDGAALECALQSGSKDVTALAMAPMSALNAFQALTRLGIKCVFISDPAYAGSDTQATSYILSEAIKRLNPDFVFCGRQSVDGDTAQVPPMLAQRLGYDIKAKVIEIDKNIVTLRSGERFIPENKTVITFERIRTLRFPSIFSKLGEAEIWDNQLLGLDLSLCGLKGSPTRVVKSYESEVGRRYCQFVSFEKLDSIILESLKKVSEKEIVSLSEKLDRVAYVGNVENVAKSIGKEVIALDVQRKTAEEVAEYLKKKDIKTVLWEDNEELKILAPKVAVLTGAGICADCISFRVENGKLIMTRPAQGGNITADIVCTSDVAFATVRTVKKGNSDIIFSVGKGAIDYIDKIRSLAETYGAEICCSRIVTDSGKLPYSAQVGLTGKTVSPKVYVAFGISGAVQHTCAIAGAGTVVAINCDKDARIFDYADYGILEDVRNL